MKTLQIKELPDQQYTKTDQTSDFLLGKRSHPTNYDSTQDPSINKKKFLTTEDFAKIIVDNKSKLIKKFNKNTTDKKKNCFEKLIGQDSQYKELKNKILQNGDIESYNIKMISVIKRQKKEVCRSIENLKCSSAKATPEHNMIHIQQLKDYLLGIETHEQSKFLKSHHYMEAYEKIAERLKDQKRYRNAIKYYNQILSKFSLYKRKFLLNIKIAYCYKQMGDYENLIKSFKDAVNAFKDYKKLSISPIFELQYIIDEGFTNLDIIDLYEKIGQKIKDNNGVDEDLNNLYAFISENFDFEKKQCPICLDDMGVSFKHIDRAIRTLTKCGHSFHNSCIEKWTNDNLNCPYCRSQL